MKNLIKEFFKMRRERKVRINAKTESVIKSYELLIADFKLIQEKKSTLSSTQRKSVVSRVYYLIKKGHIQVNQ
jgi:ribosomal protein S9